MLNLRFSLALSVSDKVNIACRMGAYKEGQSPLAVACSLARSVIACLLAVPWPGVLLRYVAAHQAT